MILIDSTGIREKSSATQQGPRATFDWPHDLLSCLLLIRKFITLGKALEFIMAGRLSGWAEQHNLLSKEQMRARRDRSTEIVLELLTELIHTV